MNENVHSSLTNSQSTYENISPAPSQSLDVMIGVITWIKSSSWKAAWILWVIAFRMRWATPCKFVRGRRWGRVRRNSGLWNYKLGKKICKCRFAKIYICMYIYEHMYFLLERIGVLIATSINSICFNMHFQIVLVLRRIDFLQLALQADTTACCNIWNTRIWNNTLLLIPSLMAYLDSIYIRSVINNHEGKVLERALWTNPTLNNSLISLFL